MAISELKKDQSAVIASVNGDARFVSRITSIGITPGCKNMGEMWEVVFSSGY